jgi:hypothetical protein
MVAKRRSRSQDKQSVDGSTSWTRPILARKCVDHWSGGGAAEKGSGFEGVTVFSQTGVAPWMAVTTMVLKSQLAMHKYFTLRQALWTRLRGWGKVYKKASGRAARHDSRVASTTQRRQSQLLYAELTNGLIAEGCCLNNTRYNCA